MSSLAVAPSTPSPRLDPAHAALLDGPIPATLLKLGLPTMAVTLAQIAVSIIETFWVSRLGMEALAAVTLVAPVLALMATMSNGGIGGGVASAVARAIGSGRAQEAGAVAWHALILAVAFGIAFTAILLAFGGALYAALGGRDLVLEQALVFSAWCFAGSVPLWVFNLLSAAMRGAGEVKVPAMVALIGSAAVVPLSPVFIFGLGPVPAMGVAGAGAVVLAYYCVAAGFLMWRLARAPTGLRMRPVPLHARHFSAILGVGLVSALGTILANLTTVLVTGAVGIAGAAAIAGYGVASRIDWLLIPLLFGFGSAAVTMVGVATGAGRLDRARAVAWTAALMAFLATAAIGAAAALLADAWMGLFTTDPDVLAAGGDYLRIVAPFYGAIGLGMMLYFASQGRGRMLWPLAAGVLRLAIAAGGAMLLVKTLPGVAGPAVAVAAGSAVFGLVNAFGFWRASRA
jgi:putative MATE family efflux protein